MALFNALPYKNFDNKKWFPHFHYTYLWASSFFCSPTSTREIFLCSGFFPSSAIEWMFCQFHLSAHTIVYIVSLKAENVKIDFCTDSIHTYAFLCFRCGISDKKNKNICDWDRRKEKTEKLQNHSKMEKIEQSISCLRNIHFSSCTLR